MGSLWRLIRTGIFNAFDNMAIDHVLLDACHNGTGANTVRFYRWSPSATSIGRFQQLHDEIDVDSCRKQKIDIVRRLSSGGAVYHDFEGELTYSIICRLDDARLPSDITETYNQLCQGLLKGLRELGVHAEFSSGSDQFCPNLFIQGRKISGNAQSRRGKTLLQHGTILRQLDLKKMFSVLKINQQIPTQEMIQRTGTKLTSLEKELETSINFGQIEEALINGLSAALGARFIEEALTPAELASARHIASTWYATEEWTLKRGLGQ
jgi:lipoate-protein ligase A